MLKLLALSLALLISVGIKESGGSQHRWRYAPPPCTYRACQVSSWSKWSHCTHQCGTSGTQTRTREKTVVESCGGLCPYVLSETRACNRNNCQNSGTPTSQGCSCKPGYRGTCCEIGKLEKYVYKTHRKSLHTCKSMGVYYKGNCNKRLECIVICGCAKFYIS